MLVKHKYFFTCLIVLLFIIQIPVYSIDFSTSNYNQSLQNNINKRPQQVFFEYKNTTPNDGNKYYPDSEKPLRNYLLNIGDELEINIISNDSYLNYSVLVNPEGKVFLPKLGEFFVINKTTDILKNEISEKFSKKKSYLVSVLLTKVRTFRVYLSGYVKSPGKFDLPYGTRLFELIKKSGGILNNGSIRNIQVNSKNNKYDLTDFIYKGNLQQNPKLKAGDNVFVNDISNRVAIVGNIAKPGIYEIKENDNLKNILKQAGDIINSSSNKVLLFKSGMFVSNAKETEIYYSNLGMTNLENGDLIYFQPIYQSVNSKNIHIYGQVNNPGSIDYKKGLTLSDCLKNSGGFTATSDISSIKITRKSGFLDKTKIKTIDANKFFNEGDYTNDILILAEDVIYVPEKFFNFRTFADITGTILTALGIVSLALSFNRN